MMIDPHSPLPKYWEAIPSVKTERVNVGIAPFIKATVLVGQMTVTAFSDEVRENTGKSIQDYARQATQRAMSLVPQN